MIQCSCPTCNAHLEVLDHIAGQKIPCPSCGQRLLIPAPPPALNRTVLAVSPTMNPDTSHLRNYVSPPPASGNLEDMVKVSCPSCHCGLKVKRESLGKRAKCPKCGGLMALAAMAPAVTIPTPTPEIPPERPRWSLAAFLLGSLALLLGMAAIPAAVVSAINFLGAALAGVGFFVGMCGLLAALTRRRPPSLPVVGLVACMTALLAVGLMAKGPSGWFGPWANASRSDREGERSEEESVRNPDRDASRADVDGIDNGRSKERTPKRQPQRPGEEESLAQRTPRRSPPLRSELERTIEQLKSEKDDERIAAAERLRKMGEKGRPAARALCEAIVSPSESVRRAALEALEKVDPALYKEVVLLSVDGNPDNRIRASATLSAMGSEGAAAVPVLLAHAKKTYSADYPNVNMLLTAIAALAKLGPGESEVVDLFKELAKSQNDRLGRYWQVRPAAINAVVAAGKAQPSRRKDLVPVFIAATESTVFGQTDEATRLAAIKALGEFGPDAKAAIPKLKDLKLSSSMPIRDAARAALDKIEKAADE